MSALVSITGAGVVLGKTQVFDNLDLELEPGLRLGVQGPNGVGKTTLLRLLATLVRPDRGNVSILGWLGDGTPPPQVRRRIGYVGHTPALNNELTLAENLRLIGSISRSKVSPLEALTLVGLERLADRPAKLASQGMLRRTDLARLLLCDVTLLLLDEPFSGLDDEAIGIVDALVDRTVGIGGSAVVVSHDATRLHRFDRILHLTQHGAAEH